MAQGLGAAGEDQIGAVVGDIARGGLDRLQAGRAIALHRPRGDPLAAAEAQGGDPRRIDLVRRWRDAAEDDFVQILRREGLAQQEGAAGGDREVDRRKGPWTATRLQEGRAAAVDYIDRATGG